MKRRTIVFGVLLPLTTKNWAAKAEPSPPRYTEHSFDLQVVSPKSSGKLILRFQNWAEPKIAVWNPWKGLGEPAYRFELKNPKTKQHYIVLPSRPDRNFNPSTPIIVQAGDKFETEVDIRDTENWKTPPHLPENLLGLEIRPWYKPLTDLGREWAVQGGVTLDTFVGDWVQIDS